MERPGEWVEIDDARQRLLAAITPLEPVDVHVPDAVGRVLARAVTAGVNVPPFSGSAMDGYAVRSGDTLGAPVTLKVVGSALAGAPVTAPLGAGETVVVATGGALVDGADAVCPVEHTHRDGDTVVIDDECAPGRFVRPAGDDIGVGTEVFAAGTRLSAAHIGVLASLGMTTVEVIPRVRVGVLATGDEVVEAPTVPGPGHIYDANRPALSAACTMAGCDVVDLGIVGDDRSALEAALVDAAGRCDVILTSGGVSVGVADHAKAVLGMLAPATLQWLEVRIKPGKPFGFAVLEPSGVPVLCLPGNPVSALVVFTILVSPGLDRRAGGPGHPPARRNGIAAEDFPRRADGKTHFVRAIASSTPEGDLRVRSAGPQGSHQLFALAGANALAVLADGDGVSCGDRVSVLVLDDATIEPEEASS